MADRCPVCGACASSLWAAALAACPETFTYRQLSARRGVHDKTAQKWLRGALERGAVERVGYGRYRAVLRAEAAE